MTEESAQPPDTLIIADTTVRDECFVDGRLQANAPGSTEGAHWRMHGAAPLAIADMSSELGRLGVDVLEAGFPLVSLRGFEMVEAVAREHRSDGLVVSSLVPLDGTTASIDRAWSAVQQAARPRLHVFTTIESASDANGVVRPTAELLDETREAIERACGYTSDVEFSPLQADGSFAGVVAAMAEVAAEAGATTINIRTCAEPADQAQTYGELLTGVLGAAPSLADVTLSADCFSALHRGAEASDEALACARVAIDLGACQVKCAMHGTAATPGHVRMEELSLRAWSGQLTRTAVHTRLDHRMLLAASANIAAIKGYAIDQSDPFVGNELLSPSPREFTGSARDKEHKAQERAALLRELGQPVPRWLEKSRFEWPLDPPSGP